MATEYAAAVFLPDPAWLACAGCGQGVLLGFRIVVVFDGHNRLPDWLYQRRKWERSTFDASSSPAQNRHRSLRYHHDARNRAHPFLEIFFAKQGVDHANHLPPFS